MIEPMNDDDTVLPWDYFGPVGSTCLGDLSKVPPSVYRRTVDEARSILTHEDQAIDFYRAAHALNAPADPQTPSRALVPLETLQDMVREASAQVDRATKPTNPKDALGVCRVPFGLTPQRVLGELGLALMEGALKYGAHNWRSAGVRSSVYFDACQRHLASWWTGEDIDPDCGVPHLVKAMACLVILRDAQVHGMVTDDRPPASESWVAELNAIASALVSKYRPEGE